MIRFLLTAATLLAIGWQTTPASAHFIYVVAPPAGESQVAVVFGEGPERDGNEAMLKYIDGVALTTDGEPVTLSPNDGALVGPASDLLVYTTSKTFGVMAKGGPAFLLAYYAKGGPTPDQWSWHSDDHTLKLDVTPELNDDDDIEIVVTFDGEPVAGVEVVYSSGDISDSAETNGKGRVALRDLSAGLVAVRAKHVESTSGEHDGKDYDSIKHYSTLTFRVPESAKVTDVLVTGQPSGLPDMPETLTSFGATTLDNVVYAYGGHTSDAHSYSVEEQSKTLWSLDLNNTDAGWQNRAEGSPLQGNALVAANGNLVLLGGFTAKNHEGEDQDLYSQSTVRAFNPATNAWSEWPSLPEPRSSFDATVLNDVIYVSGGWSMQGDEETVWHDTAWKLDTTSDAPEWEALPKAPFTRRAIALAAHNGQVFVFGGMSQNAGPATNVDIFDPASNTWSRGPSLLGQSMNGFGCAAFSSGDRLYVTTYDGAIQRLSEDGAKWEVVGEMPAKRFFHRLLPVDHGVLVLGGADMEVGKYANIDRLTIKTDE